jgi:hypothetical protein
MPAIVGASVVALRASARPVRARRTMTDAVIAPFYVEATRSDLAETLHARYDGIADRVISYLSVGSWAASPELFDRWSDVVRSFTAR